MFPKIMILCASIFLLSATGCGALPVPGNTPPLPTPPPFISVPIQRTPTVAVTNTPVPPTATATTNPAANPLDALKKAFSGWGNVKSFRIKSVRTGGVAPGESIYEIVLPDRFHMTSKTTEFILIGKDYYIKSGTTWRKLAIPQGVDFSFTDYKKILEELNTSTDVKFIGSDILDGAPTLVYQYTTTIKIANTNVTTVSKIWIAADGLPRKSESTSSNNPGGKNTSTYYDYNAAIVIEPPIK